MWTGYRATYRLQYSETSCEWEAQETNGEEKVRTEDSEALSGANLSVKSRAKETAPSLVSSSELSGTVEFPQKRASELSEQPLKGWLEDCVKIARAKGFTSATSRSQIGKVVKW